MTPRTLIILDGIGLCQEAEANALAAARTPTLDGLLEQYPHSRIATSGLAVGLPAGQMGNSEVGHMNLGAGRVVYQSLTRIDQAIADGEFASNPALAELLDGVEARGGAVHLLGLLSPGGVHSHGEQIAAACRVLAARGTERFCVHAFLDGRDTPPKSAQGFIAALEAELAALGRGRIASLIGRYYAMDRDNRWGRIEATHGLMPALRHDDEAGWISTIKELALSQEKLTALRRVAREDYDPRPGRDDWDDVLNAMGSGDEHGTAMTSSAGAMA